jgi:hypothetical protein
MSNKYEKSADIPASLGELKGEHNAANVVQVLAYGKETSREVKSEDRSARSETLVFRFARNDA